jgi:glyoxylase-like metal-dependent hydrolase (beta-lactamase superfamily II)
MRKLALIAIGLAFLAGNAAGQDVKDVIANAQKALGDVKSITYSGSAKDVAFQQCGANKTDMVCRGTHDPMRPIDNYVRVIDLSAPLSRATGVTNNIGPGGSTTIVPNGTFVQQVTAQQADASQPWAGSIEFYLTPWGFLKGAADNHAELIRRKTKNHTVVTWSPAVKAPSGQSYHINGFIDENNIVDRVETWVGENIMGDMHVEATYTGWKDFGGVKAPTKIVQTRGGWPFFEVTVTSAKANPPDIASIAVPPPPPAGRGGAGGPGGGGRGPAPALMVSTEKLGDGLWKLTTGAGSYDSIVVEMKDYVLMLEAGQSEARAQAYVAEIKKLVPTKPIRYVWNSHPHSDHTGGLPTLVAEGATVVTQKNNVAFLDKALNTPRTLLNDTLAKSPKKAKVEGIDEKRVFSDGTRTVEIYHVAPVPHSNGLTLAYIPKEKILFQGDFTVTPGEPANDHVKALGPILLDKLKLDFDKYIPVHAANAPQTKADFMKALGR